MILVDYWHTGNGNAGVDEPETFKNMPAARAAVIKFLARHSCNTEAFITDRFGRRFLFTDYGDEVRYVGSKLDKKAETIR